MSDKTAEQAQPVAWQDVHDSTNLYWRKPAQVDVRPLYATPSPDPQPVPHASERDLFEAHILHTEQRKPVLWSAAFATSIRDEPMPARLEGVYLMGADQKAWTAWQARAALAAQASGPDQAGGTQP